MSRIENLNKKKQELIEEWLKLQEIIEGYNEQAYKVSVEIEQVNIEIRREGEKQSTRETAGKKNGKRSS